MVRHHTPHIAKTEMEHEQIREREGKNSRKKNFEEIKVQLGSCCWGGFVSTPRGMRAGFKLTPCQTVTKIVACEY